MEFYFDLTKDINFGFASEDAVAVRLAQLERAVLALQNRIVIMTQAEYDALREDRGFSGFMFLPNRRNLCGRFNCRLSDVIQNNCRQNLCSEKETSDRRTADNGTGISCSTDFCPI